MEKTEILSKFEQFKSYACVKGSHETPEQGMCVMELAAHVAGLQHSDRPECVCPVIAAGARAANDCATQEVRDRLRDLIPAMIGTVTENVDVIVRRCQVFADGAQKQPDNARNAPEKAWPTFMESFEKALAITPENVVPLSPEAK